MDCKTARLLLPFGLRDLEPADSAALELHLAGCLECSATCGAELAFDRKIGHAMRQVPVPDGLRKRILARLAQEREQRQRRWLGLTLRGLGAAAALLLVLWGAWWIYNPPRTRVNLPTVFEQTNKSHPGPEEVQESWARVGVKAVAPPADYAFLSSYGLTELPGHQGKLVPVLDFARTVVPTAHGKHGVIERRARIYVLSAREFDLGALAKEPIPADPEYPYRLDIKYPKDAPGFAYLLFYTGNDCTWLGLPAEDYETR